jgi:hypothetical protein
MRIVSTDGIPDGEKGKSHGQNCLPSYLLLSSRLGVLGKTFDLPQCNGKAFTVQSKGIPASGTLD